MKKFLNLAIVFVLALGFVLAAAPQAVQAESESTPYLAGVAEGAWSWTGSSLTGTPVTGIEVSVDLDASPSPSWLQLLTGGIKIDGPATICHPFRGGQFGWQGEIRQLVEGKWVRLVTTNAWLPDEEGTFTACANASASGTYALFGYYDGPAVPYATCSYNTDAWTAGIGDFDLDQTFDLSFWLFAPDLPAGAQAAYAVLRIDPAGSFTGALTGTGTKYPADHMWSGFIDFLDDNIEFTPEASSVLVRFWAGNCTKDFIISLAQD